MNPVGMESSALARRCGRALAIATLLALAALSVFPPASPATRLVVSTTLLSMGMMQLPPVMVSLPFKVLLFIMVDGWNLVITSLVKSYA